MKKWHKRTITILILGIAGTAALGLNPMFTDDTAGMYNGAFRNYSELSPDERNSSMQFDYTWKLTDHPNHTVLEGDVSHHAFLLLKDAEWKFRIHTENGKLKVDYNTPVLQAQDDAMHCDTKYAVDFSGTTVRRRPNGEFVLEHHLYLTCDVTLTPTFWRKPINTIARQHLVIDVAQGTADLYEYAQSDLARNMHIVKDNKPAVLPSRYCGTEREQAIQHLLYDFSDLCKNPDKHLLQQYQSRAEQYISRLCSADKAWPDCWEEAAPEALRAAQLIEQTISELHKNDYYGSDELKNFIDSEIFTRIFGAEFTLDDKSELDFGFGSGTDNIEFEFIEESTEDKQEK